MSLSIHLNREIRYQIFRHIVLKRYSMVELLMKGIELQFISSRPKISLNDYLLHSRVEYLCKSKMPFLY